jgi:hypothetical protein
MTGEDFRRIEEALGIRLPESYKRLMDPFPVPHLRGNSDTDLWDDAEKLIAINQELRTEFVRGHRPWPNYLFFIGDPLTACGNAIDLRDASLPVLWVDHCALRTIQGASGQPWEEWLSTWMTTIRSDLEKDGLDPDSDPA